LKKKERKAGMDISEIMGTEDVWWAKERAVG
jgi:hypothetical protein